MREGVSINVVGVISRCRNFSMKKKVSGWTNILTIIDPFSGAEIDFTVFGNQKLVYEPGSPAVIYNCVVKTYQNKKILTIRNYTSYYFGQEIVYSKFAKIIPQVM